MSAEHTDHHFRQLYAVVVFMHAHKVGGAIVAAGRRGSISALSVINNFFLGHDMLISGLGISGYGTDRGQVREDKHAMESARSLGTQVTELIKRTKPRAQNIFTDQRGINNEYAQK